MLDIDILQYVVVFDCNVIYFFINFFCLFYSSQFLASSTINKKSSVSRISMSLEVNLPTALLPMSIDPTSVVWEVYYCAQLYHVRIPDYQGKDKSLQGIFANELAGYTMSKSIYRQRQRPPKRLTILISIVFEYHMSQMP